MNRTVLTWEFHTLTAILFPCLPKKHPGSTAEAPLPVCIPDPVKVTATGTREHPLWRSAEVRPMANTRSVRRDQAEPGYPCPLGQPVLLRKERTPALQLQVLLPSRTAPGSPARDRTGHPGPDVLPRKDAPISSETGAPQLGLADLAVPRGTLPVLIRVLSTITHQETS